MRHVAALRLAGDVVIELLIDDLDLVSRERAAVFVMGAERRVFDQLLAPDVRADEREVAPIDADIACQRFLQGP